MRKISVEDEFWSVFEPIQNNEWNTIVLFVSEKNFFKNYKKNIEEFILLVQYIRKFHSLVKIFKFIFENGLFSKLVKFSEKMLEISFLKQLNEIFSPPKWNRIFFSFQKKGPLRYSGVILVPFAHT